MDALMTQPATKQTLLSSRSPDAKSSVTPVADDVKVLDWLFQTGQTVRFIMLDAYVHGRDPTVYGLEVVV